MSKIISPSSRATLCSRLSLHRRGFKSTRFRPFETVSKSIRLRSVYTKTIYPFSRLLRHGCDMFCYQRSGNDYTLEASPFVLNMAKRKDVSSFVWTDDEVELLLRITNEYKVAKNAENVDWESVHQNTMRCFHAKRKPLF